MLETIAWVEKVYLNWRCYVAPYRKSIDNLRRGPVLGIVECSVSEEKKMTSPGVHGSGRGAREGHITSGPSSAGQSTSGSQAIHMGCRAT